MDALERTRVASFSLPEAEVPELQVGGIKNWYTALRHEIAPAKPLGCYGDVGASFTDDGHLAAKIAS